MIYMPLIAAIYEPRIAAVTLLLVDFRLEHAVRDPGGPPLHLARGAADFRRHGGRGAGRHLGADRARPDRAALGASPILVLSLVPVLASGWRYHGAPRLPLTLGVGPVRGRRRRRGADRRPSGDRVLARAAAIRAVTLRANLMVFFMFCGVVLVASYGYAGPVHRADGDAVAAARRSLSDRRRHRLAHVPRRVGPLYRRIAYAIIALAALVSLPVLDPLLR